LKTPESFLKNQNQKTYPKNLELYLISFWWSCKDPLKGSELSLQTLVGIFRAKGEKKQKQI